MIIAEMFLKNLLMDFFIICFRYLIETLVASFQDLVYCLFYVTVILKNFCYFSILRVPFTFLKNQKKTNRSIWKKFERKVDINHLVHQISQYPTETLCQGFIVFRR